jgi:hypothetical protein
MEVSGRLKTLVALSTGKESLVSTEYEDGRIPGMVWTWGRGENPVAPTTNLSTILWLFSPGVVILTMLP